MYIVYGKENCKKCDEAKIILSMKGLPFEYLQLDKDFTREGLLTKVPTARSFPVIFVQTGCDETYIGSTDNLKELLLAS